MSRYKELESDEDIDDGASLKTQDGTLKGIVYRVNSDGTYRVTIEKDFEEIERLKQATFQDLNEKFDLVMSGEWMQEIVEEHSEELEKIDNITFN